MLNDVVLFLYCARKDAHHILIFAVEAAQFGEPVLQRFTDIESTEAVPRDAVRMVMRHVRPIQCIVRQSVDIHAINMASDPIYLAALRHNDSRFIVLPSDLRFILAQHRSGCFQCGTRNLSNLLRLGGHQTIHVIVAGIIVCPQYIMLCLTLYRLILNFLARNQIAAAADGFCGRSAGIARIQQPVGKPLIDPNRHAI